MILDIFITFFKIGLFSIGGGYSVLSLIQQETTLVKDWISSNEFIDIVTISGETLEKIKQMHIELIQKRVPGEPELETKHRENWGFKAMKNMNEWSQNIQGFLLPNNSNEFPDSQAHLYNAAALAYITIHSDSPIFFSPFTHGFKYWV